MLLLTDTFHSCFIIYTFIFVKKLFVLSYWQFVGDKVAYALSQGIKVIACIGETLEQRESGSTMDVVAAQTKAIGGNSNGHFDCIYPFYEVAGHYSLQLYFGMGCFKCYKMVRAGICYIQLIIYL